jgi:hypothetical protein
MVAVNISYNQPRAADKGPAYSLGFGHGLTTQHKKSTFYKLFKIASDLDGFLG